MKQTWHMTPHQWPHTNKQKYSWKWKQQSFCPLIWKTQQNYKSLEDWGVQCPLAIMGFQMPLICHQLTIPLHLSSPHTNCISITITHTHTLYLIAWLTNVYSNTLSIITYRCFSPNFCNDKRKTNILITNWKPSAIQTFLKNISWKFTLYKNEGIYIYIYIHHNLKHSF